MTLYAMLEPVIVGVIVALSAIAVLKKQAPGLWRRFTGGKPPPPSCADGCNACQGPKSGAKLDDVKPVRFYRKHSS
ncbi:MAG: hypothetical protein FWD62_15880 [Betaproteobacteria bacterium]|nr:hypothetical protein [Betaproteobacteria bacterium]